MQFVAMSVVRTAAWMVLKLVAMKAGEKVELKVLMLEYMKAELRVVWMVEHSGFEKALQWAETMVVMSAVLTAVSKVLKLVDTWVASKA